MPKEMIIVSIYFFVDEFVKHTEQQESKRLLGCRRRKKRGFPSAMTHSEIITICLLFQMSNFQNFKSFYLHSQTALKPYFSSFLSYAHFIKMQKQVYHLLYFFLLSLLGKPTGVSFIDSTSLSVCKNKRINRHKVFKELHREENQVWVGFLVSNFTSSSIMLEKL